MEKTIDLKTLFRYLLAKIQYVILFTVIGAVAAFCITEFLMVPQYSSSLKLYVNASNMASSDIDMNRINASVKIVDTYIEIIKDKEILEEVGKNLSVPMSYGQILSKIKIEAVNNTQIMQISAITEDPNLSAEICNQIAKVSPDILKRVVKAGSVETIGSAVPASAPSAPSTRNNTLIGALIGFVLSCFVVLLMNMMDTTIKGEEDIKDIFQIPVLGEVPDLELTVKGGTKNGK